MPRCSICEHICKQKTSVFACQHPLCDACTCDVPRYKEMICPVCVNIKRICEDWKKSVENGTQLKMSWTDDTTQDYEECYHPLYGKTIERLIYEESNSPDLLQCVQMEVDRHASL